MTEQQQKVNILSLIDDMIYQEYFLDQIKITSGYKEMIFFCIDNLFRAKHLLLFLLVFYLFWSITCN